ncbi:hypothetical protein OG542_05860 [Streptomyces violaceus]|uniref:hypothetical protein n=1 Tax=Streptomyces violaceus TaxID=1936 RepID=UPI002E21CF31
MTTSRRQPRRLSTFDPSQWLDGAAPASREAVLAAHARWRAARREWHRQHAPYGAPPPSVWAEAQELAEALGRLREAEADRLGDSA